VVSIGFFETFVVVYMRELLKVSSFRLENKELSLFLDSAFIVFFAFVYDFSTLILKGNNLKHFFSLSENTEILNNMYCYVPGRFKCKIFSAGIFIIILRILIT
jgi:hypothetical protein